MRWWSRSVAVALAVAACAPAPPAKRARAAATALPASDTPAPCSAGLLCEDTASLAGFRVPRDCHRHHQGRYVSVCTVTAPAMASLVEEFVTSRYPAVQRRDDGTMHVRTSAGSLQVVIRGDRAVFTAVPATGLPLARPATPALQPAAAGTIGAIRDRHTASGVPGQPGTTGGAKPSQPARP